MGGHEIVSAPARPVVNGDANAMCGEVASQVLAHRRQPDHSYLVLRHLHTLTKGTETMVRSRGDMATPVQAAQRTHTAVKRAASNPWFEFLERLGYVSRGVLYAVMGILALGLAVGFGGEATDPSGSLVRLASAPTGRALLLALAIGLAAYSLWGFVRAIFDPFHRGDDAPGVVERAGFAWSGIAYAGLALFAVGLFVGSTKAAAQDTTQSTMAKVLAYPAGEFAVVVIGVASICVGLWQFLEAYRAKFKHDFKRGQMTVSQKKLVDGLGRLGMVARGVTFTLVGWFVLQGGLHRDPGRVHGYGGAFIFLLSQPYGHLLLGIVAIGFIALGLHSFAAARWIRLLGSQS
jgi:hypothetical protein